MSGHPTLTTTVYIIIAIVFLAAIAYMILYNRSVRRKEANLERTEGKPISPQEGIARVTEQNERTGHTGSITENQR